MTQEQLIKAIRAIQEQGIRLGTIEKELRIPVNNLSGMLNGGRNMGEKYERKLTAYVLAYQRRNKKSAPLEDSSSVPEPEQQSAPAKPIKGADTVRQTPPAGLSKSETLKWHRQHSQTLQ